ncbi:MAG: glycogen/starch synthase [Desulfobacterales bacterium]|jgi:starch synthase/alpha-amylase
MRPFSNRPRILVVIPETAFIPGGLRKIDSDQNAFRKDFADYWVDLMEALFDGGVDVHVAQPDYRRIFSHLLQSNQNITNSGVPVERIHFAEDRVFFYANPIESNHEWENIKISIAFQREVVNQITPLVQPDLIHCYHWMTGLIPAMARELSIPCLFTINNIHAAKSSLSYIEDLGIDAAIFWKNLYYEQFPTNYEETREANPAYFLLSGVFAAHFVNVDSPILPMDTAEDQGAVFKESLRRALSHKWQAGCAATFNHSVNVQQYIDLYERILKRPLTNSKKGTFRFHDDSVPDRKIEVTCPEAMS